MAEGNPLCTCAESEEEHTCPFAEEVNGDYSTCTCCEECTLQCADDI